MMFLKNMNIILWNKNALKMIISSDIIIIDS